MKIEIYGSINFVDEDRIYSTSRHIAEWDGEEDFSMMVVVPRSEYHKVLEMKIKRIEKELEELKKKYKGEK